MLKNKKLKNKIFFFNLSEFKQKIGLPVFLIKKLISFGIIEGERALDGTIKIASTEVTKAKEFLKNPYRKTLFFIKSLGPGLITGAADDDPGGIGTYSSVGARFGLAILWMAFWLLPLTIAVQEVCARIGIVTNKGLTRVLEFYYNKKIVAILVILLLVANIINIGADLKAMVDSLRLLIDINFFILAIGITSFIILMEILIPYHLYVKVLKWLTLFLFAYVLTGLIINPSWGEVIKEAIVPQVSFNKEYLFAMVAVFGTTISPYLFFWLTSEETEEIKLKNKKEKSIKSSIGHMRSDINTGMFLAHLIFFFIILTTAQVLFKNGITNIETAEEAALALKPLAGEKAFLLFTLGIIGTGLLAIPVLAGSGAYALAELLKWKEGLEKKFSQAKGFYLIIIISVLLGFLLNFFHISPIKALYYSAFINGLIAVPILAVIMIIGDNPKIMGKETNPLWVKFFGWLSFIFASLSIIILLILHFLK